MKRIIILVCSFIIIFSLYFYFTSNSSKRKKIINKKTVNVKGNVKKSPLYENKVSKINQEYTLYTSKVVYDTRTEDTNTTIYEEENNIKEESAEVKDDSNNSDATLSDNSIEEIHKIDNSSNTDIDRKEDDQLFISIDKDKKDEEIVNNEINAEVKNDNNITLKTEEKKEVKSSVKNGFYNENGNTYYYENDNKVTGIKNINGVNNYFSPSGKHLGTTKIKVIDVSYYQKDINWDLFYSDSDCYGVILRLGYWTTLDKKFERNINELKRLGIPYGIYLFSYSTTTNGALKEANFTNSMIDKYDIKPSLGIYYDLESWKTNSSSSDGISKNQYNYIARKYVETVKGHINNNYPVGIYSGRWYAMNRLGKIAKGYVSWVAEYNSTLKYDGPYFMWQYTSKASVPGISGNVDMSYIMN